jgi:hypothetical protein
LPLEIQGIGSSISFSIKLNPSQRNLGKIPTSYEKKFEICDSK